MASTARFIGLTVRVSLAPPGEQQLTGTVKEVQAGSKLILSNVSLGPRKPKIKEIGVPVDKIVDIVIEDPSKPKLKPSLSADQTAKIVNGTNAAELAKQATENVKGSYEEPVWANVTAGDVHGTQEQGMNKAPLVDPAIVSFQKKRATTAWVKETANEALNNENLAPVQRSPQVLKISTKREEVLTKTVESQQGKGQLNGELPATATLTEPFSQLPLDPIQKQAIAEEQPTPVRKEFLEPKKQKQTRSRKSNSVKSDAIPSQTLQTPRTGRGGRRAQDRARKTQYQEDPNGWATGEATDIQDMGDFDFEENLSKFDKRKVFEEIRQGDTTAEEDRLHTFNRKARPGTAGGKNLHYTEMVLGSPKQIVAESSADDEIGVETASARRGSDRSVRKILTRSKPQSRPGSNLAGAEAHLTGSGSLPDIKEAEPMSRVSSTRGTIRTPIAPSRKGSAQYPVPKSSLVTLEGRVPCPVLSPLQMLELEQLAISEFGVSEDMITENAGRGIAMTALNFVNTAPGVGIDVGGDGQPFVVVLAGNTKTGARAIAAARQLRTRHVKVVLVVLGLENEGELLESVRRQLGIYRQCEGRAVRADQLERTLGRIGRPVGLVIDAMLGMHLGLQDLDPIQQEEFMLLAEWTTRVNDAGSAGGVAVMALDVPSGVDAASGNVSSLPLLSNDYPDEPGLLRFSFIPVNIILSLGAPKTGLLNPDLRKSALHMVHLVLADIGIPPAAWKRFGKRFAMDQVFGQKWVVGVDFADKPGVDDMQARLERATAGTTDAANGVQERNGDGVVNESWAREFAIEGLAPIKTYRGARAGRARRGGMGRRF